MVSVRKSTSAISLRTGRFRQSTLAFEFASKVAEVGPDLQLSTGDKVDYVIFLSGKETEFNVFNAKEVSFKLRQFAEPIELFQQIIFHSGISADVPGAARNALLAALKELFDNFSGLIILDDIDALSRAGVDTGEEDLFLLAATALKRTRILYTLRDIPTSARSSAIEVPGLDASTEFFDFLERCCAQFSVPPPLPEHAAQIIDETSTLPLLIETIVGLRKNSSNYDDAVRDFKEKGGDGARRYLHQREYDRLNPNGKGRQILAALMVHGAPLRRDALSTIVGASSEQAREAISETMSIFLKTSVDAENNTIYDLSPPTRPSSKQRRKACRISLL
jgi:hypothetical protein